MDWCKNMGIQNEGVRQEGPRGLGPEAISFIIDLGICPGRACPGASNGCDPRCPALVSWLEEVSGG
jgi:hypothetical protein